jgi:hypothetical protein
MDNYNISGMSLGDLNASIDQGEFRRLYADVFSATLGVDVIDSSGPGPILFAGNERWGPISVGIEWDEGDTSAFAFDFDGRLMSRARVSLTTPYHFKTGLLREYAGSFGANQGYMISESVSYIAQIIN